MTPYRILVTGSREWANRDEMNLALEFEYLKAWREGRVPLLIHGGARGADTMAGEIWLRGTATGSHPKGLAVEVHPADWDTHGKAAGFIRNQQMVDRGADVCLAFLARAAANRGTRDCMGRAEAAGITVREVWDD